MTAKSAEMAVFHPAAWQSLTVLGQRLSRPPISQPASISMNWWLIVPLTVPLTIQIARPSRSSKTSHTVSNKLIKIDWILFPIYINILNNFKLKSMKTNCFVYHSHKLQIEFNCRTMWDHPYDCHGIDRFKMMRAETSYKALSLIRSWC